MTSLTLFLILEISNLCEVYCRYWPIVLTKNEQKFLKSNHFVTETTVLESSFKMINSE